MIKERVTVDFDEESYYLDGKYWKSWDSYGEEMAEEINKLLDKQDKIIKDKEEIIKTKNKQLENVKDTLIYYKKLLLYTEIGLCTNARLDLIERILNKLDWND